MWQNYSVVARLDTQDDQYQKALLLCAIGEEALEVYNTFEFEAGQDSEKVSVIIAKFDDYFTGDTNETYERFKFNQRNQADGETFDNYLTELKNMRKTCNFCQCLSDSLLRDRIVLGIRDDTARKRLLQERKLDLKQCIDICKSVENATTQMGAYGSKREEIMAVNFKGKPARARREMKVEKLAEGSQKAKCKFCLKTHVLKKEMCPAWGKKCNVCGKLNHWKGSEMCRKKQVHCVENNTDSDSDIESVCPVTAYVNEVKANKDKPIYCKMLVGNKPVELQIDCGATVNIIPKSKIGESHIEPSNITLEMWNTKRMKALGTTKLEITNPKNSTKYLVKFVVVQQEFTPLLSRKAAEKMKLIVVNYDKFENVRHVEKIPQDIPDCFSDIFDEGLGTFPGVVNLTVKPDATPSVCGTKRLAVELKESVKTELDRLVSTGVLAKVETPTDWVSQVAVVTKGNGSLRICIDPRALNNALKREHYQLPVLEDVLPDLSKARIFSKVDLRHGFWHCVLDEKSSELTTFSTPFGRYKWTRLPFGLSVSSEIFQKRLHQALEGLSGVACIADDILIYGAGNSDIEAVEDHDKNMRKLLERCREKSIKLNKDKLSLRVKELEFMGHRITSQGLKPDPHKTEAILKLEAPKNKEEIQRFCGAVNYLAKFLPNLSQVIEPIRQLTRSDIEWQWTGAQDKAFQEIKHMVTKTPVLAYYDPKKELSIQCDASSKGIGAALLQEGKPIAYASRALTDPETRYATIEKEMLAIVYSLEKWHQFAFARHVTVYTDHKPLESIVKKPLDRAPKRLQSMLLRCLAYDVDIKYNPGSSMHLADMMSRSYLPATCEDNQTEFETVNAVKFLPMREERIQQVRQATEKDNCLQLLKTTILKGWPDDKAKIPLQLTPYYSYRDELGVHDGLVFKGDRLVVPHSMREEMKRDIHIAHSGIEGCLRRARECVYWPGMNSEIKHWISTCEPCRQFEVSHSKETLMSHDVPERPWEKVGVDLLTLHQKNYLITVDYYSNFWELDRLEKTTSTAVIRKLKAHFARYGIPSQLISDNGPQFVSAQFQKFTQDWDIEHLTTSPHNSKANGKAESAVKSAKRLLRKTSKGGEDQYLALLSLRNTPNQGVDSSPVQRLMNRRTRTLLPVTTRLLEPRTSCKETERKKLYNQKQRQAHYYNQGAKNLQPLEEGDTVRMKPFVLGQKEWKKGVVTNRLDERSYEVCMGDTLYRRNRAHLRKTEELPDRNIGLMYSQDKDMAREKQSAKEHSKTQFDCEEQGEANAELIEPKSPNMKATEGTHKTQTQDCSKTSVKDLTSPLRTRSGRAVRKPSRFKDFV